MGLLDLLLGAFLGLNAAGTREPEGPPWDTVPDDEEEAQYDDGYPDDYAGDGLDGTEEYMGDGLDGTEEYDDDADLYDDDPE